MLFFLFLFERMHLEIKGKISERTNDLIIQSDTITMNSRRDYQTARISAAVRRNDTFYTAIRQTVSHSEETIENQQNEQQEQEKQGTSPYHRPVMEGIRQSPLMEQLQSLRQLRQRTIDYLLYLLFGRSMEDNGSDSALTQSSQQTTVSYFYESEEETTYFETTGSVHTTDGRDIPFQISLEMSRSFTRETQGMIDFSQPVLCDPLVINLDHCSASVSDQKFYFDLDGDGNEESISMLSGRRGFLALDRNEDGIINNGTELFGAQSGNGFSDLAAFDEDNNGWIDEADSIFSRLKIMSVDANGRQTLVPLSEAGVGAICLKNVSTDFDCKSEATGDLNARIRRTGFFLYENGESDTMQQLDLAT